MKVARGIRMAGAVLAWMTVTAAAPLPGQEPNVQMSIVPREGTGTTVCLEAAPGVRGRKRADVSHDGGLVSLSVSATSPGPNCTELADAQGTVTVGLRFARMWVIPSSLGARAFPAAEVRGKRITFRWMTD
ncbi:MAG TPA: hypothetical protein VE913_01380 [Longimicrobium sp.]|nr:hypothetical protein [Longimicrobium sp.]